MYSIIIQNRKTRDSFGLHYPLFLGALDRGRIDLCRWNESGTTVDKALPGLRELTDGKEEWRAVIVHIEDETNMAEFARSGCNPFDFSINEGKLDSSCVKDSPVPIIKLTYILGGLPAPIKVFEARELEEKIPPKVVFEIDDELERQKEEKHGQLSKSYWYNGRKPSEIVLITFRKQSESVESHSVRAWQDVSENTSSDFWERNRYPSNCRFMVFDVTEQGHIERDAEIFRFWASVLMIATNDIEPSFLQAYRLYKLDAAINAEELRNAFQAMVNKLRGAHNAIEERIKLERHRRINEESKLPDYFINIPVAFDYSSKPVRKAKSKHFRLAPKSTQVELIDWEGTCKEAEQEIASAYHATDRVLNQTTERLHGIADYTQSDIRKLDKYEVLDFEKQLEDTYGNIMHLLGSLPKGAIHNDANLIKSANGVKETILSRITMSQALRGLLGTMALLFLSFIPAMFYLDSQPNGSVWAIAGGFVIGACVLIVAAVLLLCIKRHKISKAATQYVKKLRDSLSQLYMSSQNYSKYLSGITSHIRGSSYLKMFNKRSFESERIIEVRNTHKKEMEKLLNKLEAWSGAFHLNVNFGEDAIDDDVAVDPHCPPRSNHIYTFEEHEMPYKIQLNIPGSYAYSPFSFIDELKIIREELYNDD